MLRAFARAMTETLSKRRKMTGPLIGTHNGHFHADEALAVYMLRLLPQYADSPLVRTRDPSLLQTCHTVVDVGGVYDSDTNRYDHHQREFSTTFPGHSTKLSSAGLVFMHFGKAIIAQQTGKSAESEEVEILHKKLYEDFVEAFDANDNGISAFDSQKLLDAGISKRFNDRGFSIASIVNRYNHAPSSVPEAEVNAQSVGESQDQEDARFFQASTFTGSQFVMELSDTSSSWLPARKTVEECFNARQQYDEQGRIIVLPWRDEGLPYHDHLNSLEEAAGIPGTTLYALMPQDGTPESKWRIRAISLSSEGFELRKALPEPWRGVRDEKLSTLSGIPGCIFVHASGFIGANDTFDGVLEMARVALKMP